MVAMSGSQTSAYCIRWHHVTCSACSDDDNITHTGDIPTT